MTEIDAGAFTAYVSPEDSDLEAESWYVNSRGYVVNNGGGTYAMQRLHRVVMARALNRPLESWELIDHIDGDKLNNRRDNLRLCNYRENAYNAGLYGNNTTGYTGVYRLGPKHRQPFAAAITVNRKKMHLGCFPTAEAAADAYEQAARQHAGEFYRGRR